MHIAFLTPEYPHERVRHAAGIGSSIKNLAMALVQEGVQVSVFVYSQKISAIFVEDGIKIHLISHKKYRFLGWFFYRKYVQDYLNRIVVSDKIDLIEAPDWTGITAFMSLKAPVVLRLHGSDAYFCHLEGRKQKRKNFWFEKIAMLQAKAFVAPTDFAGTLTKELFGIKKKIETIPNGLQMQHFVNPQPEAYEKGLLLYIGTLIRKKGVLELPAIFSKVIAACPEARLLLIGADAADIQTQSASTWELLQGQLDDSIKDKVTYLGKLPYDNISNYLQKAHVCVFPTFAETQGMVTIEAMAMQKAVVNSNIGWAKELLVDGESGYLVHPADHDLFASRILELLAHQQLTLEMGKNARIHAARHFDSSVIVKRNIKFYQQQL